ncbi:MAG: hypothetical protein JW881_17195 [Spirochaetales bacterium]|nr:hypothetical protein [Spirochaetales bacterium]
MNLQNEISITELKKKCGEQTRKFHKGEEHTTRFCFELFRRFFEENCDEAIAAVYAIYRPLISHWVKKHKYFDENFMDKDEVVFDSMSNFIFSLRRYPFTNFTSIGALLSYWRKCIHTVIMSYWRKNKRSAMNIEDVSSLSGETDYERQVIAKDIWARVRTVLCNPDDILLSRLIFVYNMKPRHIAREYPEKWKVPDDVRVNQQRIKRQLQKDEQLLQLLEAINN